MGIREVAQQAGVATTTAWRVLHGDRTVDSRLARRVRETAEKLRYYPSSKARTLVSGSSRIVGLIVSEITNPFFPPLIQSFEEAALKHGYEILLATTGHNLDRMKLAVRRLVERRVDGIALLTLEMEDMLKEIESLHVRKTPFVIADALGPVHGMTNIRIDYEDGIRQAVQHLAALRHRRVAFVAGPPSLRSAVARREAFERCVEEICLDAPPELIVAGDHSIEAGMRAVAELFALVAPPTAVICSNDLTAIGVMHGAYDRQIAIPSQLSVIGSEDIRVSEFTTPPLTTIRLSQCELGSVAFDALQQRIAQPDSNGSTDYSVSTDLVLRKTTTLLRNGHDRADVEA